jgi:hypothetical protein
MQRTWLILASALFVAACSSQGSGPIDGNGGAGGDGGGGGEAGDGGTAGNGGAGGQSFSYPHLDCDPLVPEYCGFPFPSNVYTIEDDTTVTGRRVRFLETFLRGNDSTPWDYSDGFSAGTPIMTQINGATGKELGGSEDIEQSLSNSSPTILLDAENGELVAHFAEIDSQARTAEERATMIRPAVRLRDNARYIVAIRNLTNEADEVIEASPEFAALRDDTPSDDESIEARRDLYEDIFEKLEEEGWDRSEVQMAWDFNTASDENNTRWLLHMRDTAFELIEQDGGFEYTIEPPELDTDEGAIDPANIAFRIFGTFKVPLFMSSPEPGSLLLLDENDMPMVNEETPWADIPFEVLIPQSAKTTPAPIIEYGHGLFGEKEQIQSSHFRSFMNQYNYIFVGTDLQGMSGPDVDAVIEALGSGKFSEVQTMWDRLHQGFLNHLILLRMMKTTFSQDPMVGQYVKGDEAYYHGISQGGIMGSVILAATDDVDRGALGVMGMPYSLLVFRSVDFDQFLTLIRLFYPDRRTNQLLLGMGQMPWDRVEPMGWAHHVTDDAVGGVNTKEVLMRAAIADHQVTTLGAHILARTMNAPMIDSGLQDAEIRREIWGLDKVPSTDGGSFYIELDFGLPGEPDCNVPMSLCRDPHERVRRLESSRIQLDAFLQNGTGTNHCEMIEVQPSPPDGPYQPIEDGVCSYPQWSGCEMGETEEATQALCMPSQEP